MHMSVGYNIALKVYSDRSHKGIALQQTCIQSITSLSGRQCLGVWFYFLCQTLQVNAYTRSQDLPMLFAVCSTVYYTGSEFNKHKHVFGVCIQPVSTIIKFMVTISKWWTILKVLEMELLRSLSSKHTHKHNIN